MPQQDQHTHSTTNCPLRSMAWITVDQQTTVTHATAEIIALLGFNPVGQSLDDIWQPLQEDISSLATTRLVSTVNEKVLEICQHANNDKTSAKVTTTTIICTDMTELNHMYTASRQKYSQVAITRLTMYGTIDAVFQSDEQNTTLAVGQPMMRYIHSDDVQQFCAGLKQATKYNAIAAFCVRFIDNETFEFTVMAIEGGKVLCLMKPSSEKQPQQHQQISCTNNNVLHSSVTRIQHRFWYALEHGMACIARHLANSLIMMIQTAWCFWHDNSNNNKAGTWSGLFSTSSEYLVKKLVSTTKERPEIDTLCHLVSYIGISKQLQGLDTNYNENVDSLI
ncbi:unnamed protein product [Mucor fragilis]